MPVVTCHAWGPSLSSQIARQRDRPQNINMAEISNNTNGFCANKRRKTEDINTVTVVLGAQWGDEGKGKIVDLLATSADIVCRCQV